MAMLIAIGAGVFGFVLMAGAELAGHRKMRVLKPALWIGMVPVSFAATVLAWASAPKFTSLPVFSTIGWIFLPIFFLLFLFSLYAEIPLITAYIKSDQPEKVVISGTYSLSRHPALLGP